MLKDIIPETTSCEIALIGGEKIEISFRPFTLRDLAWIQKEFDTDEKIRELNLLNAEPLAKVVWQMMDAQSKAQFGNIIFEEFDEETGQIVRVKVTGYKKILHSVASQKDLVNAYVQQSNCQSMNNFIQEHNSSSSSKKKS